MELEEFWWLYEYKRPRDKSKDYAGSLTRDEVSELARDLERMKREQQKRGS